jgi:hypothetical protein
VVVEIAVFGSTTTKNHAFSLRAIISHQPPPSSCESVVADLALFTIVTVHHEVIFGSRCDKLVARLLWVSSAM